MSWAVLAGRLPTNVLAALAAAGSWGGGDFAGGMAVKSTGGTTAGSVRVVMWAHLASLCALLLVLAFLHPGWIHAKLPAGAPAWWAFGGGVTAGLSIAAFYIALARGAMGAAAAVSGLLAAAIPAALSSVIDGRPGTLRLAGFALAGIAIWFIAGAPEPASSSDATFSPKAEAAAAPERWLMALAIGGGIGFGLYFVALRQANPLGVLLPLALARTGSTGICLILLLTILRGTPGASSPESTVTRTTIPWILGVALLDSGGNLFYILATRLGRLDVAAVLSALYPAATILLAAVQLGERPSRPQMAGMAAALLAIPMITL